MIRVLDLNRTANTTEDALLMAAKRADALLELGDVEGQRVWNVLRAVEELVRIKPKAPAGAASIMSE